MKRVILTPNLPPQTAAFKRFDQSMVALNRFYWTYCVALSHMLKSLPGHSSIPEFLPGELGKHLNISCVQFRADAPASERTARYTFLVMAVTIYEDYLKEIVSQFLAKNWKHVDSTYKIEFRSEELPTDSTLSDFIKDRAIKTRVKELISKSYSSRFESLCSLLTAFGKARPNLPHKIAKHAAAACKARNCVIHSGGQVDSQTLSALSRTYPKTHFSAGASLVGEHGFHGFGIASSYIPNLALEDQLELAQPQLMGFLGALRDSARAVDVAIRTKLRK